MINYIKGEGIFADIRDPTLVYCSCDQNTWMTQLKGEKIYLFTVSEGSELRK